MEPRRSAVVLALILLLVVAGSAAYVMHSEGGGPSTTGTECLPLGGTGIVRHELTETAFGGVKEYALPLPLRWSNAITVAPDGSVWFGEQSVPGVGHLYSNGTLVEYPWPNSTGRVPSECDYKTGIWGILIWNGGTWATSSDDNSIVGVDQRTGDTTVLNVTRDARQPYTLSAAPDGSMWFTALSGSLLGRVSTNLTVSVFPVSGLNGEVPIQVEFVNSSWAYFVAIDPLKPYGRLYAFDPAVAGRVIVPTQVGGAFPLLEPSSVSSAGGRVWVTQHGASSLVSYDETARLWTTYPTTTVNFTYTTLPYFVEADGAAVWFNEHYANRIGLLNATAGTLTEFSEANPPVENGSLIQNDLTIAGGDRGLWFTSTTGNYVGFVNGQYRLPFSIALDGPSSATISPGREITLNLTVQGTWTRELRVGVSDSENYSSIPKLISIAPNVPRLQPGAGPIHLQVRVRGLAGLAPGEYTVAISISDRLVTQSVYCFLRST